MDPKIESALKELGAEPEKEGESLVLRRLPAGLEVKGISGSEGYYVIGETDAHVAESGTVHLAGKDVAIHRCTGSVGLRPQGEKIGEGGGNLKRRSDWFQKRSG